MNGPAQFSDRFVTRARMFSRAVSIFVMLVGAFVITGWFLDIHQLKTVAAGITMKANTAIGLLLVGASLWWLNQGGSGTLARRVGAGCAMVAGLIGALTLSEHIFGWNLHIDQIAFSEAPGALATTSPGRMGPPAATCFTLSGMALLLLHARRAILLAQGLAIVVGLWGLLAVLGYAYQAQQLYGAARYTGIALHTALALFALSLGLLAARANQGLMATVSAAGATGEVARRLLITAFTVPLILGWFRALGERRGYFDLGFGVALAVLVSIVIFGIVIWRTGLRLNQLEKARLISDERFRLVVEAAPSAMVMVNARGCIALVNAQTENLFGYPRAELLGQPVELLVPERYRHVHPDHRLGFLHQPSTRAMGAGRDLYGLKKDGSEVPIEIGLNPIKTDEGAFVLADIIDITSRKEAEDVLRGSEERAQRGQRIWEQTFDAIGEGILVHDNQMQIVRCNARAAEMLEMKPADVIGLRFSEVFARLFGKRAAAYYLTEGRGATSVFEVETEFGRRYLVSMFPLQHPEGDSVSVVTWTDVTTFLEMQEQLSRSRRLASVGELAAGVAHEINNPLAAITTCAEATMRDMRLDDATQTLAEQHQWSYYLEEIVRQAMRCKEITRGLLDLTRQRQANRIICDLNALAAQCAKIALQRASTSAIEFEINLDEKVGEVATDAAMVRQILDNLLSNAIDALGENGGKIIVSTLRDSDRVAVQVADTGTGIPADVLASIFEPFFSTKGPGKGYGLGLAISLTLAESLGGALTVESKEGAGSRFRLWIPRRAPE